MNWYSIGLAGASGLIAALIAIIFVGRSKENSKIYSIVVIICFLIINTGAKTYLLPRIDRWRISTEVEQSFSKFPVFKTIKKYKPEFYTKMIDSLLKAQKKGLKKQELIDLLKMQLSKELVKILPYVSDSVIVNYSKIIFEEMIVLYKKDSNLCYKFLFPQVEGGIDLNEIIDKDLERRDLEALNQVILASLGVKSVLSPTVETDAMKDLIPIYGNLANKYGKDLKFLANPISKEVNRSKVCEMNIDLFQSIFNLPIEKSAIILRWFYLQNSDKKENLSITNNSNAKN